MKRRINPVLHFIGRMFIRLVGWKFVNGLPNLDKYILISGPHTSNWDTIYAMGVIWTLQLTPTIFIKHTMFRRPFGWLFRWLGGVPIDRTSPRGTVAQVAEEFERRDQWVLLIAPEGRRTRDKTRKWKTGFYHIALAANVPIVAARADFKKKQLVFSPPYTATGNVEADIAEIKAFIDAGNGYHY
jgi:1-acyl-sn-glycerol-3-phosphate acyltransferase